MPPKQAPAPAHSLWRRAVARSGRALRRIGLGAGALALLGALYQHAGAWVDARAYPPPGRRVDVGGYQLHLHCAGTPVAGRPTVILDTLAGGTSSLWVWVQPEIAATTRVCAYDRAGWGWSDDGPAPRDAAQHARELRTLLERAGVPGPYVLAGHSLGGLYVRSYADMYPGSVAGMVLVDAAHPDQARRFSPEQRAEKESLDWSLPMLSAFARLGAVRLYFDLGGTMDFEDLPTRQRDEVEMFWSLPRQWDNQAADRAARPATDAQLRAAAGLGDRPLLVVTAARGASPEWLALQAEMVGLSTNSAQRVVPDGTHVSLTFHPDHARLTARAILDVVAAAVTGARVRP